MNIEHDEIINTVKNNEILSSTCQDEEGKIKIFILIKMIWKKLKKISMVLKLPSF